jgi:hypothetical protein
MTRSGVPVTLHGRRDLRATSAREGSPRRACGAERGAVAAISALSRSVVAVGYSAGEMSVTVAAIPL